MKDVAKQLIKIANWMHAASNSSFDCLHEGKKTRTDEGDTFKTVVLEADQCCRLVKPVAD